MNTLTRRLITEILSPGRVIAEYDASQEEAGILLRRVRRLSRGKRFP